MVFASLHIKRTLALVALALFLTAAPEAVEARGRGGWSGQGFSALTPTPTTAAPSTTPTPTTAAPSTSTVVSTAASSIASASGSTDDSSPMTAAPASDDSESASAASSSIGNEASALAVTSASASASSSTSTAVDPGTNATTNGTCTFSEPTSYVTTEDLDWLWTNRLESYVPTFYNFIFDQLITNNGKLNYCIRWDSTNTLNQTTAAKMGPMLQRQLNIWNDWLKNYGCWPLDTIEVEVVGFATNDSSLFGWSDDSLGKIYVGDQDDGGVPQCPTACYKHTDFAASADTSGCSGTGFDMSLWLTEGMDGGAGGDWGQRVNQEDTVSWIDQDTLHIVAHEMGHGFGLPDFYETTDEPSWGWPNCIMKAGSSMVVNYADGWMLRWVYEKIYTRYNLS